MRTKKEIGFMNKYKLSADPMNIIVQEKHIITGKRGRQTTRIGEESWKNIAYFATPQNALDFIIEKEIRESWVDDLKEVVKGMDRIYKAIQDIKLERLPQLTQ